MPQFNTSSTKPVDGTILITQQCGADRILFEVNAGKMVSIRVEPRGLRSHLRPIHELDTVFDEFDHGWSLAEGNC